MGSLLPSAGFCVIPPVFSVIRNNGVNCYAFGKNKKKIESKA
jgi:hypothetical protein